MKKTLLLILLLMVIFLSGYSFSNTHALIGNNSIQPSWENITLGVTSKEELLTLLPELSVVNPKTIISRGKPWNIFDDIVDFTLTSEENGQAYILDNKVVLLEFFNVKKVTFSTMIEKYGVPQYVFKHSVLGKGFIFGDAFHLLIEGVNIKVGIIYGYDSYSIFKWKSNNLKPGTRVSWIDYFDPADYDRLLELGMFTDGFPHSSNDFYEWNGYGDVYELYPSQ